MYSADYYLAISSGIKKQLIQLGIPSQKISLIFNPVVSDYHIIDRPTSECRFIYLGRVDLDKQKNIKDLLIALSKVIGKWQLNIYGDNSNAQPVQKLVNTLNLQDKIKWNGFLNDPWNNIPKVSALVLTSNYEGLPMVLCEAISHGVYCISSDIETGPDDIIQNGVNGHLYMPNNIKQLTKQLQWVITHHNELPNQQLIIESSKKFSLDNYGKYFTKAVDKSLKKQL